MKTIHVALLLSLALTPATLAREKPGHGVENGIGMRMAYIPAGEFVMGSAFEDGSRMADELPHKVAITRAFRISTTEVSQGQWRAIMDSTPSRFPGDDRPVESVSWKQAVEFCKKLSQKEGKTYRLPTEAEWEYACRAGDRREKAVEEVAWHADNSGGETHVAGEKQANRWGLYDMLGNVAEWCGDSYGPYPDEAVAKDPTGATEGTYRVVRGGSFLHFAAACRPAARMDVPEAYQMPQVGLRVVEEMGK